MSNVCFYIDPQTAKSIRFDAKPSHSLPYHVITILDSIESKMQSGNVCGKHSLDDVSLSGDIAHMIVKKIEQANGTIFLGMQKSNRGLRMTGFYSIPQKRAAHAESLEERMPKEDEADVPKEDEADVPKENEADVPKENEAEYKKEITAEDVISQIDLLTENSDEMTALLTKFFGSVHLYNVGLPNVLENLRGFK